VCERLFLDPRPACAVAGLEGGRLISASWWWTVRAGAEVFSGPDAKGTQPLVQSDEGLWHGKNRGRMVEMGEPYNVA
jgi:hypothetical protein